MSVYQRCLPYGVAIASTAIALLLTIGLEPWLTQSISVFFFVAITITSWHGGLRPGFVAIVLSTLVINFSFVPPDGWAPGLTTSDGIRFAAFSLVAIVVHGLSDRLRQSQSRVEQLNQQLLEESASRLQVALEDAQTNRELLKQQFEQQRVLLEISQRIRKSLSLRDILQTTVDEVRQLLQTDRVIIFQFFSNGHGVVAVESCGSEWTAILSTEIYDPCFNEVYVEPFRQGGVIAKSDIYTAGIRPCHVELLENFQVRANLVVPIIQSNQLWGLLIAHHCSAPRSWQEAEIDLLKQISAQVSIALQQSALFEQAQAELNERKQAENALQQLNSELEQRVVERTAELAQVNAQLLASLEEQHHTQQLLAESEESRRLALDLTHIGFWDMHLPTGQTIWNDNHFRVLGLVPDGEEPSYELWRRHVHPGDLGWVEQQFLESVANHTDFSAEYRIVYPDGSVHWLMARAKAMYGEAGEPLRSVGVLLDVTDRKQAEEASRQSNERFRQLAENIEAVFWIRDVQTQRVVYVSPAYETIWQRPCANLYENFGDWLDAIYPDDRHRVELAATALTTVGHYDEEYRIQRADASLRWVRDRAFSIYNKAGEMVRIAGLAEDITHRKQTELTLQQQTQQKQLLWNITQTIRQSLTLPDILTAAVTEVRQFLRVDRAAVYRFYPDWSGDFVAEAVTDGWVKLVETEVQKVWEDTYLQETAGGRFQNHETLRVGDIYQADLQPCHIELLEQFQAKAYAIAPIFVGSSLWGLFAIYHNGTPHAWEAWEIDLLQQTAGQLAIAIQQSNLYNQLQTELQERKQAAAVLREAERRWRSLLDNVQLLVVGLDATGHINYVNPFFLTLTGYTRAEVLGQNWIQTFLHPSNQGPIQTIFSGILAHNGYPYYQDSILTKSGEERFIAWNNTRLQDASGCVTGMISIGEDITERQKVEAMKNEFIGIVSHELRTPLTAIQMSLGLLKTGIYANRPEKAQRMIEIALTDTNRLVNLVNDILDLERLESGRAVLEKARCSAANLMQQAMDGMQAIATQQRIQFAMAPTTAIVWASADAIIQTLTNLLSNAIKFSPAHSTIYLQAEQQADHVLFQVRDQGRGIPSDMLEAVFGRFHQVDASDSREKGGTGLGLPICRSIIERHGGKIWAESSLGNGSTFYFTLPLPPETHS